MYDKFSIRTDLALEDRERFAKDNVEIHGVIVEENFDKKNDIKVTMVRIETENGAKTLNKSIGTYVTIESPNMIMADEDNKKAIVNEVVLQINKLLPHGKSDSVLVVGLGNHLITPDSLGPCVVNRLNITRHLVKEYGKYAMCEENISEVSAIIPGVMAYTGMESLEIISGIVQETNPKLVIAIDALAARNSKRLNRTIQLTNTGISPGAGVGNHRNGINEKSLGVPVIAIGVPTVVEASTLIKDAIEKIKDYEEDSLIAPHLNGLYVTPKDIGDAIDNIGKIIAESLNIVFGV